jgi:hypothetical protein
MRFYIHCHDCGEHSEIYSNGESQEFCPCSSIEWTGCDSVPPGECTECDELVGREVCGKCKARLVQNSGDWCAECIQDEREDRADRLYEERRDNAETDK